MSLINQVLKDLEQRHAGEMADATQNMEGLALAPPIQNKSGKIRYLIVMIVLVLVCGLAGGWWWYKYRATHQLAVNTTLPPVAKITPVKKTADAKKHTLPHVTHIVSKQQPVPQEQQIVRVSSAKIRPIRKPHTQHKQKAVPDLQQADDGQMEKQMVPLQRDQKAEIAYQAAYDQIELHNLPRAEVLLRRALSFDPAHIRARELLAGLMIKQGRWVETAGLMQQGLKQRPENTAFLKLYARVLMQLNRDRDAIDMLRAHAPGVASDPDYYALLAALYQRQHDHRDAAKIYAGILKFRPDTGIWWVGLGISLEALGKTRQAQQAYARARKTGSLGGDMARFTDNRLLALDAINYPMN